MPNITFQISIGYHKVFLKQVRPTCYMLLGGCPFNGQRPLSGMKYPTRESPHRDAASIIKYNGLRVRPAAVSNLLSPIVI